MTISQAAARGPWPVARDSVYILERSRGLVFSSTHTLLLPVLLTLSLAILSLSLSLLSVLSRKLKPHLVADTVKQYISRAQRTTKKGSQEQQNNMEFLRGVYAFMQVSRSSVSVNCFHFNNCTNPYQLALLFNSGNTFRFLFYHIYHIPPQSVDSKPIRYQTEIQSSLKTN